jgi:hypothetical protein
MSDVYCVAIKIIKQEERDYGVYGGRPADSLDGTLREYDFTLERGSWSEAKSVIAKAYEVLGGKVAEEEAS